ncbi:MAG: phage major tail protein, TP901-1 family [Alphaproteobacteria bacterium HGW-Alphaproteobacteria-2]|nr:MAG: phage major tail protein, TP901-1 family [Alphaproteobacteria bacterium HGW-Alphaproteobacteria-2]
MAVQRGKDLLVKMDLSGSGNFQTVAGLRATRISFNAQSIDITALDSAGGWRELLAGAGVKSAAISGSGIFRDGASDARMRQVFFDGDLPDVQVVIPDFGLVQGAFQVTSLEYAGSHDGEASYEIALASAGALAFTAL